MYTRAKEIGRKVMAGGENNIDAVCSRCDVVKYMSILRVHVLSLLNYQINVTTRNNPLLPTIPHYPTMRLKTNRQYHTYEL